MVPTSDDIASLDDNDVDSQGSRSRSSSGESDSYSSEEEDQEYEDEQEEEMEEQIGDEDDDQEECSSSLPVILTNPDVLDCPICFVALTAPVFQCNNGHIACSNCCCKIRNVCPSCSLSIGSNRCRAIENVLESIEISCKNIKYGCKKTTSYNKKHEHELMCIHEPCSCPHLGCDFVASSKQLYMHSYRAHTYSAISFSYDSTFSVPVTNGMEYAVLRESTDKTLFVLNYAVQSIGNVASITCISPSSVKKGFSYELVAQKRDSKIKLESFTECMPRWSKYVPHGEFLLVPSDFLESQFLLVRIQKGAQ
ncbi:E3 ubiquitin-protein ligase SINA-like 10 isoform X2 [Daucus carota subsp. sativus]|uniref:RING-type E3 ubiquitin transferase n=1 Tax=Daucus carota subsp. sativus TaxID=79200 RepID=A0A166AVB4_DAUCS|nr:PREDICTED: E3 ubiquitin-protein ligase SINA-like 10 isoform X2 [Daucus carota subsp. sativus]